MRSVPKRRSSRHRRLVRARTATVLANINDGVTGAAPGFTVPGRSPSTPNHPACQCGIRLGPARTKKIQGEQAPAAVEDDSRATGEETRDGLGEDGNSGNVFDTICPARSGGAAGARALGWRGC